MKVRNIHWFFVIVILMSPIACKNKIDIEKEKAAIKSVIEEEKNAYFDKDIAKMSNTWVQNPSSAKLYMTGTGPIEILGWGKIAEHDKVNTLNGQTGFEKIKITFSDYKYNINKNNAWVILKATWDGIYQNNPIHSEQTRILALEKIDGKWKFTLMAIYNIPQLQKDVIQKGVI